MRNRQLTKLSALFHNRIAKVCLVALSTIIYSTTMQAQTEELIHPDERHYNKDVRTKTLSIYAQGGVSWATGLWYENTNAKDSYSLSPAFGGGIDFTIKPWVRVGADYLWSRYRREQRHSAIDPSSMPVKPYGNYMMNFHNVKIGAGFNVMEFWPNRGAQWLNIWVGTGVGYMIADGNEYGIWFNNTITQNGATTPITGDVYIDNTSSVTVTGNVRTTNDHSSFRKLYIPATLNVEFDVSRQVTLGLKGEIDWVMNRKNIAPENLIFGLATIRYNFVTGKAKRLEEYYSYKVAEMNDQMNEMRNQAEADRAQAATQRRQLENEISELKRSLDECEETKSKMVFPNETYIVNFCHNSATITEAEAQALREFAESVKGKKLSLLAEASSPGNKNFNQKLSERRLQNVIDALIEYGCNPEDIKPTFAIGEQRGVESAEARRVTITVE